MFSTQNIIYLWQAREDVSIGVIKANDERLSPGAISISYALNCKTERKICVEKNLGGVFKSQTAFPF